MRGKIYDINSRRGMVAVLTETEGFSVFEILSGDIEFNMGDEVSWTEEHPLGDCEVHNLTSGDTLDVYFQNHWVSNENLNKAILK